MSNRGFVGTVIAIIVVVVAIGAAIYFGFARNLLFPQSTGPDLTPTDVASTTPEETEENDIPTEPTGTTTVKIYFQNSVLKPNTMDCSSVVAIERVVSQTETIAKEAINQLLAGPTAEEKEKNYSTSIPAGSKLVSLKIENGTAYADFNDVIDSGGGSCRAEALTTQIRKTLLQFPTITKVILTAGGKSEEESFQP